MHAVGYTGDLAVPGNLERARRSMLEKLTRYLTESERQTTLVVFDLGRRSTKKPQQYNFDGIEVVFSAGFDDADSMIESLIRKHEIPERLLIVSSDHRIQNAARRRQAMFIDSERWIDRLEHPRSPQQPIPGFSTKPTPAGDTEYWLDHFNIDDVDETVEKSTDNEPSQPTETQDPEKGDGESFNPFPDGYGEELLDD